MKEIKLVIQEIDKHQERLIHAKLKIIKWGNITVEMFQDFDKVETIDSFIFRFSKMQDTIGEKLFPLILQILEEEVRNKSFIDILNTLERLEFIPSAKKWRELREIRNQITHTYPWEQEILVEEIKKALISSQEMIEIYNNIKIKISKYLTNL
ncbi:hypothetical protein [Sulfurihydrogenibium sp.]|uniref:hypothetical protein n=1 Tax=Sulfurihydrogenibium sp. TaxID=2053621 RepID=UPI002608AC50|nr:hypothetical protein [Sulfurihydrogenibium sp.]